MNLYRDIFEKLLDWKNSTGKMPLIIRGARQTGKTWCMLEFGRLYFEKTAYFNFESNIDLRKEFEKSKDPATLLPLLELYCGFPIHPENTLIIFDEIQECNEALNSLKYFSEICPQYHIICAGSLLGVALRKEGSFPVGRVEFLTLYPLTFREFLRSSDVSLFDYIESLERFTPLPEIIFRKLADQYTRYKICGGMPKAVLAMLEDNDIGKVNHELELLLQSYALDFKKHASVAEVPKITAIWQSLPAQLARENRKFMYGMVKSGARAREYESALEWLQLSGLIYKVNNCKQPLLPLTAYDSPEAFKVYVFDIGILRALSQLDAKVFLTDNPMFREFKGAFAENAALQDMIPQFKVTPRYWTSAGTAEVDFLIQESEAVIPVEIKASDNISGKSMKVYMDKYEPPYGVIISSRNVDMDGPVKKIPHGLTAWLRKL